LAGCATTAELEANKAEAEKARAAAIKVAQSFANYKKEAVDQADKLKQELTTSKAELETARRERDGAAAALEALRKETERLQRESGEEIASLRHERESVTSQLESARAETVRISEELEGVRRKMQAQDQSGSPVVVTTKLVPPPDLEQKVRQLEDESARGTEERQRLERRSVELEQLLAMAQRAEADAKKKAAEPIRLRIVDQLLFDSGEAQLRTGGCKLLRPLADRLRQVTDHQIRIEGHTDNKPPKPKLRSRYPSNWELSSARASNIVRCLIGEGRVPAEQVSAVGFGASRPIASNDTDEGRRRNRRVEIVLYPVLATEVAKE
jgi:chemotaxis protein MotB